MWTAETKAHKEVDDRMKSLGIDSMLQFVCYSSGKDEKIFTVKLDITGK